MQGNDGVEHFAFLFTYDEVGSVSCALSLEEWWPHGRKGITEPVVFHTSGSTHGLQQQIPTT